MYKILLLGNSYAGNQGDMVYSAFKDQSREFNIFFFSGLIRSCLLSLVKTKPNFIGCEFMTETDYPICRFPNFNYSMVLHELKPDIVFILTRLDRHMIYV